MDITKIRPTGNNVLVRLLGQPKSSGLIELPDTAKVYAATGPEFRMSRQGVWAEVIATGPEAHEVAPGEHVLVDRLGGDYLDEGCAGGHEREHRIVRVDAIVAAATEA